VAAAPRPTLKELEPVIRSACTERQRHALALAAAGYSLRQMAEVLGVTRMTAREHLRAAVRNVRLELERAA
jgi:DNA-binding CsgD family transcriptional regulator